MAISNLEKDKFFVGLVESGKLLVTKDGIVTNPATGRRIGYRMAGYWQISYLDRKSKIIYKMLVHRLVWLAFNGLIPEGIEVNHKDEDRSNPALENLDLTTGYGNLWYSKNGRSYDSHVPLEKEWSRLVQSGWSCNRIGVEFGVAGSSVARRLRKYNLQEFYKKNDFSRKGKIPDDMTAVTAAVKARGYRSVSVDFGVTPQTVRNWFVMSNIDAPRFRSLRCDAGKKKRRLILSARGPVL